MVRKRDANGGAIDDSGISYEFLTQKMEMSGRSQRDLTCAWRDTTAPTAPNEGQVKDAERSVDGYLAGRDSPDPPPENAPGKRGGVVRPAIQPGDRSGLRWSHTQQSMDYVVCAARLCSHASSTLNPTTARIIRPPINHQGESPVAVPSVALPRSASPRMRSFAQG